MRQILRFLPRASHVWRTEGLRTLLRKARRRYSTTAIQIPVKPLLLQHREPLPAVRFSHVSAPYASVIIPVFQRFELTHHCLAALHADCGSAPIEVIVVDDCGGDDTADRLSAYTNVRIVRNAANLGFIGSCNRGAAIARGRYLVFLNSDTQVQSGWLEALLSLFDREPEAGLVGSHLIYPSGRQQDAGGILSADGSAWSYGHLDDPYKPQYGYVREVDYCSGAAIAIPRSFFQSLGGFDAVFAPAYYEDADLAMRVRAAGHKVYYQPSAHVVHWEGATAGTDIGTTVTGMKRFQALNQKKFVDRWRKEIANWGERGEGLELVKERRVRRRAFIVDNYMVMPDKESGSLRMSNLFAVLQQLGFKVTFAAANLEAPQPYLSQLQQRGIECLYRNYVRSIKRHLAEHGHLYDLVILSRADAAAALMVDARRYCTRALLVYDTVDLHFLREARLAQLTGDAGVKRVAESRRRQELELVATADATLVVSAVELELLRTELPRARLHLVSNIHQIHPDGTPFEDRRDILFIGAFAHPPNTDAVRWLATEILPSVRAQLADLCFHVIGADPPSEILSLAGPGLAVHGYVPDVVPYFRNCRLSVAPLRYGAGVKGKINQSLAYGLPVVATTAAVEGMYLIDEESALIADDAASFAAAVVRLYNDSALWRKLSETGLEVMEEHFSFKAAEKALVELLGE